MATRNKTPAFLQQRNAIRHARPRSSTQVDDHVALNMPRHTPGLKRGGGYVQLTKLESPGTSPTLGPMSGSLSLPPQWVDISERVKEDMEKVRKKMAELGKVQARALLPSFGAEAEKGKTAHEEKLEVLTSEITKALKSCEQRLHRLAASANSETSTIICKNIQRSMATDLQALSMDFRKQSKQYLKRLQEQQLPKAQRPTFSSASTSGGQEHAIAAEDDEALDLSGPRGQMLRKGETAVDIEREKEMQEIFQNVQDLAQIMKDLSVLVIDQGTIVDRIDHNITSVQEKVKKGVEQLEKAEKLQKRSAMVGCIMCLIVGCVILIILLVLKKLFYLI